MFQFEQHHSIPVGPKGERAGEGERSEGGSGSVTRVWRGYQPKIKRYEVWQSILPIMVILLYSSIITTAFLNLTFFKTTKCDHLAILGGYTARLQTLQRMEDFYFLDNITQQQMQGPSC